LLKTKNKMLNEKKLSKAELAKREELIMKMKPNKRNLVKKYGADAEKVMYGRATNMAKKLAEQDMEQNKLREMVKAALSQPIPEKKEFPDLTGDGKVTKADILKGRGVIDELKQAVVLTDKDHDKLMKNGSVAVNVGGQTIIVALKDFDVDLEDADYESSELEEDIDLGHQDNEPHMIKAELYRIGKYAMELYQMLDGFEGEAEVDFPAWWQAKLTTAMNNMVSAKHYLDFEIKEPEIDAAVNAMTGEEPEMEPEMEPQVMTVDLVGDEDEIEEGLPKGFWKKKIKGGVDEAVTSDFEERIDQIVNHYFKGDQEVKNAAIEYASIKGARVMGGLSATASLFKDFYNKYSDEVANQAMEVIDMADDDVYFEGKETAELDESFAKLVSKLEKQGKSKKAATAIAGAVASYKAKGGGKGPTKKQQAR
jgi:hypothetical protein